MIVGIDFDNTIVDYTGVFHQVAVELGWIPAKVRSDKTSVRDYLRLQGGEDRWIELQGLVYGPHIFAAKPPSGLDQFLALCRQKGFRVFIISHKTRHPFLGEAYDLHVYARQWLERNGFFTPKGGIKSHHVFLELTKEEKLARIEQLSCDYFVDDLPEVLTDPRFPSRVRRILLDPRDQYEPASAYQRVVSWEALGRLLT